MKFRFLLIPVLSVCALLVAACSQDPPAKPEPIDSSGFFLTPPPGSTKSMLRIVEVNANPQGDSNESFILKNFRAPAVNMTGWAIRAPENRSWILDNIILDSGKIYTYHSLFSTLLKNNGDTLYLIDAEKDTIQMVIYGTVAPGQRVRPR